MSATTSGIDAGDGCLLASGKATGCTLLTSHIAAALGGNSNPLFDTLSGHGVLFSDRI